MRRFFLFNGKRAKEANTPPMGFKRTSQVLFALLMVMMMSVGNVWGATKTVSWSASTGALGSAISAVDGTASGTIATTGTGDLSFNWSYTRTLAVLASGKSDHVAMSGTYMQLGSSNAGENVEFRTSAIPGTIKRVKLLAGSKDSRHTGTITVGGTDYNAGVISAWASSAGEDWQGTGSSSGEIVISISCNEKKSPIYIASITVEYEEEGSEPDPILKSITIGGDLKTKSYEEGQQIDFSGLTVTGNYDNSSSTDLTSEVEWSFSPALAVGTTSYTITATIGSISDSKEITDVAVTAHVVTPGTYPITPNNTFWGTSYNGTNANEASTLSGSLNDISLLLTKSGSNLYVNDSQTRVYENHTLQFSVPAGYVITAIAFTADGSNWAGTHTASVGAMSADTKNWAGSAQSVTITFGGTCRVKGISVTYAVAPATYAVTFEAPTNGSLTIKKGDDAITSGAKFAEGTELTVETDPADGYLLDELKAYKTGDESTEVTITDGAFEMPAYAVTVEATFKENEAADATLTLSENGAEHNLAGNHKQGDVITLPTAVQAGNECAGKVLVGWSANPSCAVAPEYAKGDNFTLSETSQTLYAVYAKENAGANLFTWAGGTKSDLTAKEGVSALDADKNDYAESYAPYRVKWNGEGKYIIISVTSQPGKVSAGFKMIGGTTTSTVDVQEATTVDGEFTTVETLSISGENNAEVNLESTKAFKSTTRAIKLLYHKGSNVGLGPISIVGAATNSNYATTCVAALAEPVFDLEENTYAEAKSVTITADEGDIYYTINGDDPTSSASDKYTSAIELSEAGTYVIKAIAINGTSQSAVVTKTYTINLPLTTIQGIFDKASSTVADVIITFDNWVVSAVTTKNAYITDGTKGFMIYDSDHGFAVKDKLSGTVSCKLQLYRGFAEVTNVTAATESLTVTNDGEITFKEVNIADLNGAYHGAPIIVKNVTFDGSALKDESENAITPYTTFYSDAVTSLESGKIYDITGIYLQFSAIKEIAPRQSSDIVKQSKEQPTMTWYVDNTKAEAIGESYAVNEGDAFVPVFETNSTGAVSYTSSASAVASIDLSTGAVTINGVGSATITASVEADDDYVANSKSFTLTVKAEGTGTATWVADEWATANEIEDATKFTEENGIASFAVDANLTFAWSKNGGNNDPAYYTGNARIYTDNQLTITSSNGKIINKVELTFTSNSYTGTIAANEGAYSAGTWTGFANKVIFTNSGDAARISQINIEYVDGTVSTLEIADVTMKVDDDAKTIEFTSNRTEPTIVYSGYNEEVITITDGKITPKAVGKTTVMASIAAAAPYSSVSTTFQVTVKSGTEVETVVVILAQYNDKWYAMKNTSFAANSVDAIEVDYADGVIFDLSASDQSAILWTRIVDGTNVTFQNPSSKYLYGATGGGDLKIQDAEATWNWYADGGYYRNGEATRTFIYRDGYNFKHYSLENIGKDGYSALPVVTEVTFVNREVIRDGLSNGKWGTLCPDHRVNYPTGASFYTLTYLQMEGGMPYKLFFDEIETDYLEAGKPYLFIAEGEVIKGVKEGDAVATAANYNGFYGNVSGSTNTISTIETAYVTGGDVVNYYGLTNNTFTLLADGTNVAHERAVVQIKNGQLDCANPPQALPAPRAGVRRVVAGNNAPAIATGMDELNASETPVKMMIDGHLFILCGEKMYNANGQLVK